MTRKTVPYLLERWLWWSAFGPIIFAHKPLCNRFSQNVVTCRGFKLCRSCLAMLVGLSGFGILHWIGLQNLPNYNKIFLVISGLIIFCSYPPIYDKFPRFICDILRIGLGAVLIFPFLLILNFQYITAALLVLLLAAVHRPYKLARTALHKDICLSCPEYKEEQICSGLKPKYLRMKKYEAAIEKIICQ